MFGINYFAHKYLWSYYYVAISWHEFLQYWKWIRLHDFSLWIEMNCNEKMNLSQKFGYIIMLLDFSCVSRIPSYFFISLIQIVSTDSLQIFVHNWYKYPSHEFLFDFKSVFTCIVYTPWFSSPESQRNAGTKLWLKK